VLLVGNHEISFDNLHLIMEACTHPPSTALGQARQLLDFIRQVGSLMDDKIRDMPWYLQFLLYDCGRGILQTDDRRDQIFSVWQCFGAPVELKPDYDLTTAQVFARAAHLYQRSGRCNMLLAAGLANRDNADPGAPCLPSWVPDWSKTPMGYFL
jgi:hypothetical protein